MAAGAVSPIALAHHSFSATFVEGEKTMIEGVVTNFSFRNPHVLLYVDVTNEDGTVTNWVSEGNSATLLRRSGWDAETFAAGTVVQVSGDSTRDGTPMTSIDFVHILDPDTGEISETKVRDNRLELYKPEVEDNVGLVRDDGTPNVSGVWAIQYRGVGPPPVPEVPLNETGLAIQNALDLADDPQVFCDPPGLARQAVTHHPTRFTQNADHVLIEYEEFAGRRKVYFDDRAAMGVNTHLGDSVARYEGNKLIIETTNLLSNLTTTKGKRLSDEATITEAYHRVDGDHDRTALNLNIVVKDPLYLAEDLVVNKVLWDAGTDYTMLPNDCHPPLRERTEVHPAMSFFVPALDGAPSQDAATAQCTSIAASVKQGEKAWLAHPVGEPLSELEHGAADPRYSATGEIVSQKWLRMWGLNIDLGLSSRTDQRGVAVDADTAFYCIEQD